MIRATAVTEQLGPIEVAVEPSRLGRLLLGHAVDATVKGLPRSEEHVVVLALTSAEASALLSAVEEVDSEYGFEVGAPESPTYPADATVEECRTIIDALRAEVSAAQDRGQALIEKLRDATKP